MAKNKVKSSAQLPIGTQEWRDAREREEAERARRERTEIGGHTLPGKVVRRRPL